VIDTLFSINPVVSLQSSGTNIRGQCQPELVCGGGPDRIYNERFFTLRKPPQAVNSDIHFMLFDLHWNRPLFHNGPESTLSRDHPCLREALPNGLQYTFVTTRSEPF
jgi:hypothetical protein